MTSITNALGYLAWMGAMFLTAIPKEPPEKVYIYIHPLTQWICTDQGMVEYKRACHQRVLSGRTSRG